MAFINSVLSVVKLDDSGGTPADISAYVTDITVASPRAMYETTTLGQTGNTFIPGLKDGDTVTITMLWDSVVEGLVVSLYTLTASSTLEMAPEGTTTGKRRMYGEVFLKDYSAPVKVGSVVQFTATFQKTGAWTRTVY